jgi:predicted ArsR family transcriptional regulator
VQVREGLLLALLEQRGSLACEQAAAQLGERPESVRDELERLRERGFVGVFGVGELRGYVTTAAAYWRITAAGRAELTRYRRADPDARNRSVEISVGSRD